MALGASRHDNPFQKKYQSVAAGMGELMEDSSGRDVDDKDTKGSLINGESNKGAESQSHKSWNGFSI